MCACSGKIPATDSVWPPQVEKKYAENGWPPAVSAWPRVELTARLSAGTFFYAALLGIEGVGLLLRKHWAEYFTIFTTGALLPLEMYELAKHVTMVKIIVLVINAAIVWYLVVRVRSRRYRS